MSWPKIVLIALYAFAALITVANVGKAKAPTTPALAATSLVMTGAMVWLVVIA